MMKRNGLKWTMEEEKKLLNLKKDGKSYDEISLQLERSKTAVQSRFSHLFLQQLFEDIDKDHQELKDVFHITHEEYEKILNDFLLYYHKKCEDIKLKKCVVELKKENKIDSFIQLLSPFNKDNQLQSLLQLFDMEENIKDKEFKKIFEDWLMGEDYLYIMSKYTLILDDFCTILRKHLYNIGKKMKNRDFHEKICERIKKEDYSKMKMEIPEYHPLKIYIESVELAVEKYKDYKEIKPIKEIKELPTINEYVKEKIGEDYLLLCKKYGIEETQLDKILDEQLNDKNYEYNYKQKYYQGWFNNSSDKFVKTKLLEGMSLREIADIFGRKIQEVDDRRYKFIEDELKILVENTFPKHFYKK